jgi:DNA-binding NarL/FixJ family response regulator
MDIHSHEHLLDMLSTMLIQLNGLQALMEKAPTGDNSALHSGMALLEQLTREMIYEVRSATEDQPLPELEGVTLAEALSQAVEETAEELGFSSRVQFSGEERTLPKTIERLLYRVVREALYQVRQHSGTRRLRLTFNYGRDEVQMSIEDDGALSAPGTERSRELPAPPFGEEELPPPPFSLREKPTFASSILDDLRLRLAHSGGSLEVSSVGGQGTRLQVRVPYSHVEKPTAAPTPEAPAVLASSPQVRVLVVDGQSVTRAGLKRLLESYPDLRVVGVAGDGVHAVSETLELGPHVVLMDMQLPNGQSLEALRQIKQLNLDTHVLLLSAQEREELLYETLRAGADGFVLKDIAPDELAQAVRAVARGEVLVRAPSRSRVSTRGIQIEALTAREEEVLRLLSRGLRNKEIAARLFVSERTVNFHLANIYQKLNVSGRTEALSRALEQGLITA